MLRILLVDDNPHDRLLAIRELEREFPAVHVTQVIQAADLTWALDAGQFDLTISDYQLRWSDGLTVVQTVKSRYPDRPVIMFTNSGTQEVAVEAMKSGLDDYIIKSPKHYVRLRGAVRAVLERAIAQRKAAGLEVRFQTLLNQLNVAVYRLSSDGALLEGNAAFLRLLGLNSLAELPANQPLAGYFQSEDYAELLNQLKQNAQVRERDLQLRRADGTQIWVRVSKTFTQVEGITIIDGLMEDISDRKQAEQALRQSELRFRQQAEALDRANRVKDEFLAVLSHELRSPLNAILGWSKLLRSHSYDADTLTRAIATIERNASTQAQLIDDLLDISSIVQGKLSLNVKPIDLVLVIEAAIETMRLAANAKSIDLKFVVDSVPGPVVGDETRLQQVIWNLLSNAIKFTPAGGQVWISLAHQDTQIQIRVRDTGQGISADFLPHVFDYFRQFDASITRVHGGLGLGLAIVRHLVELHGGTVWAESSGEGKGATFTVELPLMRNPAAMEDDKPPYEPFTNLDGIRVLVVDDEADTREFIAFLLDQYGATVRVATSALEALAALAEFQPDILLSDVGMPEMDGYMLLRQVRTLPPEQSGQVPAIALTAYAGEINQQKAIAVGFQTHLSKPVDPAALIAAIAQLTTAG
ncbi:response regulator [Oculatella sp. LEGE 06141]|uniref:hybrid sensor histidine kinase/response regulator n=1 Tax=Oculatella sp. LEGE 06141 TaxID=1828648 RepID=UPI001882D912|nr:response regulator [Oculatella sp. LEGE 06141]MBE9178796.1 response regulator [Oculatella sp. LEGE 06141]